MLIIGTAIPKPFKKQSNALILTTKIVCHIVHIFEDMYMTEVNIYVHDSSLYMCIFKAYFNLFY